MPYLGSKPTKGNFSDLNGGKLILDADADTSITADTDDQIDIEISGANDFKFSANAFNVLSGSTLTIDSGATIANSGTATGFGGSDPSSADGDTLGTASLEWSDLYLADGSVIYFGNDQEVTLTHNHDTSLTCNLMVAATTFEPTGDTASSDNAAIGYTSAEGLILTGQGSTNDVTIKNDADADVITIATGATNVDVVGDLTAGTLNADGDTAAGDNAAIGYTSAEGLILTGQGSTNDVTIKNDADADVIKIPTGTTGVTLPGALTAASITFGGSALNKYVTGSWTPVLIGGSTAGTQSYDAQAGEYIQIGRMVIAAFTCVLSAHDSATNGVIAIAGHPKTVESYTNANHNGFVSYQSGTTMPANEDHMALTAGPSDADFDVISMGSGGIGTIDDQYLSDSSRISGMLIYTTAA